MNLMADVMRKTIPNIIIVLTIICCIFQISIAQVLGTGDAVYSFFWTQMSDSSVKNGCYGYVSVDSAVSTVTGTVYGSSMMLPAYKWWHDLFPSTYLRTEIQTSKRVPGAVSDAVTHFSDIEWFTGFTRSGTSESIRFYFPILPTGSIYGRYDYYTVDVDEETILEFYGAGDSIMAGSFVSKQPGSRGELNILARNAFIVELTQSNPLRIKSILCNGAHDSIISSFLGYDLSIFKQGAAWYGIDFISIVQNIPIITLNSIALQGTSPFLSANTYSLTWKLSSPQNVDSCIVEISFDNKATWNKAGKTGADSLYMLTIPSFQSDSAFVKVTAFGKLGEQVSSLSSRFSTKIIEQFKLSVQPLSEGSIVAKWNPYALTLQGRKALCLAWRTGSFVTSFQDGGFDSLTYSLQILSDTITGLNSNSMYYFTAFVRDSTGNFQLANGQAIDSATAADLTPPQNNFVLDTFFVDSSSIGLLWYVNGLPDDDADTVGIWFNEFNCPQPDNRSSSMFFKGWGDNTSGLDTIRDTVKLLSPGQRYYFSLFTADRAGNWSENPDLPCREVRTLSSTTTDNGKAIKIGDGINDTLPGGSMILLDKISSNQYIDTVDLVKMPPVEGFAAFPPAFAFRYGRLPYGGKVTISLNRDISGTTFSINDLRIYRFNYNTATWRLDTSQIEINNGTNTITFTADELRYLFAVMIDTVAPEITGIRRDSAAYTVTTPIVDRFTVIDNIENPQISLLAGSGSLGYSDITRLFLAKESGTDAYTSTIPAYVADQCSGLRGLIVVNDGTGSDTANISRRIIRSSANCDDCKVPAMEWTPVLVTALPEDTLLSSVLALSLGSESFVYDNTRQRIIQCKPGASDGPAGDQWVEYSDKSSSRFSLSPGRLHWIKSGSQLDISYGTTVIPALIDTFKIVLKAGGWTDFALPYMFDIYSGDITGATAFSGGDVSSIELYRWAKSGKKYSTECVYLSGLEAAEGADTVIEKGSPLSAFNSSDKDITLRIPPVSLPLSSVGRNRVVSKKKSKTSQWSIKLLFNDRSGDCFSSIYCAETPSGGTPKYFTPAPSLAPVSVTVLDKSSGREFGHAAVGDLSDGGETFFLSYQNYSDAVSVVTSSIGSIRNLPAGIKAVLYHDKFKGSAQPSSSTEAISIAAKQKTTGYLLVGSNEYIAGVIKKLNSVFSFFPFTANNMLKIRYTLPIDIKKVSVSVFDLKGRIVSKVVKTDGLSAGEGFLTVNHRFSSGYYIIQMRAEIIGRNTSSVINRRWMFVQ